MKSFFKRSAISMIVLSMAGSVYAASPAKHHNVNNNVNANNATYNNSWSPHTSGWFIGVEGLDLRAENGDLDFYQVGTTFDGVTSTYTQAISTSYQWNWRLFGGFHFGDNDDFTVSWMRMRNSDSEHVNFTGLSGFDLRYIDDVPFADGHVNFDVDNVYGVLGHTIYFNNPWSVRFAAGVEYARVESNLSVSGFSSSSFEDAVSDSEIKGWGPRVEVDLNYHIMNNFSIFANTNAALLVSERDISFSDISGSIEEVTGFGYDNYSDRHVVIPRFGMRLGASYTFGFGQAGSEGAGSAVTLSAGWQVESYVHAIERGTYGDDFIGETRVSNFGDQGLFLGIKFSSDWM